jgi:hypothetical protein
MVVIAVGGFDTPLSKLDTKVMAFALPRPAPASRPQR